MLGATTSANVAAAAVARGGRGGDVAAEKVVVATEDIRGERASQKKGLEEGGEREVRKKGMEVEDRERGFRHEPDAKQRPSPVKADRFDLKLVGNLERAKRSFRVREPALGEGGPIESLNALDEGGRGGCRPIGC